MTLHSMLCLTSFAIMQIQDHWMLWYYKICYMGNLSIVTDIGDVSKCSISNNKHQQNKKNDDMSTWASANYLPCFMIRNVWDTWKTGLKSPVHKFVFTCHTRRMWMHLCYMLFYCCGKSEQLLGILKIYVCKKCIVLEIPKSNYKGCL